LARFSPRTPVVGNGKAKLKNKENQDVNKYQLRLSLLFHVNGIRERYGMPDGS
jgi:hypothetical protein